MDRVILTLVVAKTKSPLEEKYYVVGDLSELGSWQEKKMMKRLPRKMGIGATGKKENHGGASSQSSEVDCFYYSFYTYRSKEQFYYYYIKKGSLI